VRAHVVITAGGTSEAIDSVRCISNISSGRLATALAYRLLDRWDVKVSFVHGRGSLRPDAALPNLIRYETGDVASLIQCLTPLLDTASVLVHAMAVSDFYVPARAGKISSSHKALTLPLKANPKVIDLIRRRHAGLPLFAFKLESGLRPAALNGKALALKERVGAQAVVANQIQGIGVFYHHGRILFDDRHVSFYSKADCARKLADAIMEVVNEGKYSGRH